VIAVVLQVVDDRCRQKSDQHAEQTEEHRTEQSPGSGCDHNSGSTWRCAHRTGRIGSEAQGTPLHRQGIQQ
jgi:hypothetical protein